MVRDGTCAFMSSFLDGEKGNYINLFLKTIKSRIRRAWDLCMFDILCTIQEQMLFFSGGYLSWRRGVKNSVVLHDHVPFAVQIERFAVSEAGDYRRKRTDIKILKLNFIPAINSLCKQ